jgi:hypothetical protein
MRRPRFTIGGLLGIVVFIAVAFAALRVATDLWDSGVVTAALSALMASLLMTVHRRDRKRTFWLGFALFGWSYLIVSLVPPVGSRLVTTKGLAYLDSKVADRGITLARAVTASGGTTSTWSPSPVFAFSPDGKRLSSDQGGSLYVWDAGTGKLLSGPNGTTENFVRIGHSLIALVMGFFGGCLSRRLYDKNHPVSPGESFDSTTGSISGP